MKKPVIAAIGAGIIIIAAVVVVIMVMNGNKKTTDTSTKTTPSTSSQTSYKTVEACDVLTATIGAQLAGSDATTTPLPDTTTNSVNVSNCSYYSSSSKLSVGLLVRSPQDSTAADTNSSQFTSQPADAQSVSGYGTSAYWSPSYGQLNILSSNNTWYILSFGPLTPASRTLTQTEQFADLIKSNL